MPAIRSTSQVKRAQIMQVVRQLVVERGYEGTTIRLIEETANVARGSITYLAGPKPAIAADIYLSLVDDLIRTVRRSIAAGPLANSASKIIETCLTWMEDDPSRLPLLDDLDKALRCEANVDHQPLSVRLAAALAQLGQPAAAQTGDLRGSELYALLLAPLLEELRTSGGAPARSKIGRQRWLERLTTAARAGLQTEGAAKGTRRDGIADLFGHNG